MTTVGSPDFQDLFIQKVALMLYFGGLNINRRKEFAPFVAHGVKAVENGTVVPHNSGLRLVIQMVFEKLNLPAGSYKFSEEITVPGTIGSLASVLPMFEEGKFKIKLRQGWMTPETTPEADMIPGSIIVHAQVDDLDTVILLGMEMNDKGACKPIFKFKNDSFHEYVLVTCDIEVNPNIPWEALVCRLLQATKAVGDGASTLEDVPQKLQGKSGFNPSVIDDGARLNRFEAAIRYGTAPGQTPIIVHHLFTRETAEPLVEEIASKVIIP
jgi:hypothetical protein